MATGKKSGEHRWLREYQPNKIERVKIMKPDKDGNLVESKTVKPMQTRTFSPTLKYKKDKDKKWVKHEGKWVRC